MPPVLQSQFLCPIDFFIPERQRFDAAGNPRVKELFVYSSPFNGAQVLPAGGTITDGIPIDADSDFLILAINAIVTLADNVTFIQNRPITIDLTTTGGGNRIFDQPIHLDALCGDGQLPGIPPWPKFLPGSSQLQVTLTNLDPANAYNVWIAFPGAKVF